MWIDSITLHRGPNIYSDSLVDMSASNLEACPACSSHTAKPIGPPSEAFDTCIGERRFRQPAFSALRCQHCSLVYKSSVLAPSELAEYYRLMDFHKWENAGLFPTERQVINVLRKLRHGASILDFGCSSGRLLSRLVREYKCYGIEINASAAMEAELKGIRILDSTIIAKDQLLCDSPMFDAIVMVDVFEHLMEPTKVIEALLSRLRPTGWLIISTGNADSDAFSDDLANSWYLQNVEHVIMMTKAHAAYLSDKYNLALKAFSESSHYETTLLNKVKQLVQRFSYEQFSRNTLLAKTVLSALPYTRRAKRWRHCPFPTFRRDHALVWFDKSPASG